MLVDLPTGKTPGWELNGRVRGKPDLVPPAHTLHFRGRCQIEIGPHSFPETSFYEVQYHPAPVAPPPVAPPPFVQSAWQSQYSSYVPYGLGGQAPVMQHTSPLLSSLSSVTSITPNLINQVNAAAASNPTLANLLQIAAAGRATAEQLKTLGLLIQSLASPESSEAISAANSMPSSSAQPHRPVAPTPSVKEFDLVFQYYEASHERWILPRVPVICEKVADARAPGLTYDIVLTLALPSPRVTPTSPQIVTIRLRRPPPAIWETIWRWVGGEEKLNENRSILDNLKKKTQRAYLAHRIPQNSLLTQLQNAAALNYVMRPIKPGPIVAPKPKRKAPQRKPPQPTLAVQPQPPPQASETGTPAPVASASTSTLSPATPTPMPRSSSATLPDPKRRKIASKPKQTLPMIEIRCVSCQQTDVPLILGGRFCRPCVDSGKATTVYVPYRPPQNVYQQNIPVAPVYAQAVRPNPSISPHAR
ncbi:hypothetical protein C8F04DRAFT_1083467, partial [Mycena alexandri]